MGNLINRNAIRSLEKAAKDKNKNKLAEWIASFQNQIDNNFRRDYDLAYEESILDFQKNLLTAVVNTLYFSEENYIDKTNIGSFMKDLFVTLDLLRIKEYTPKDYREQLDKENIYVADYDSDLVYKKYLDKYDNDLVKYLRNKPRKIITLVGCKKFNEEINKKHSELVMQGNMIFSSSITDPDEFYPEEQILLDQLIQDQILISDILYVYNKDQYIGKTIQSYIDYAKEHNKDIIYKENI